MRAGAKSTGTHPVQTSANNHLALANPAAVILALGSFGKGGTKQPRKWKKRKPQKHR